MFRLSLRALILACFLVTSARAADDVGSAVHGTINKVDSAARTITVKTKDGTEHTVHVLDSTVVHGAEATASSTKDTVHGLTEGTEVVAHYAEKGGEKTAVDVYRVGKGGVKAMDGTVSKVGEGGKTVVVKAADGTEHTFAVAGEGTADAAKDLGKASEKSGKVTVYYTEKAGKKIAHFFEKL